MYAGRISVRPSIHRSWQAEFVSSPSKRFTKTGAEAEDGKHEELDLVFCATGPSLCLTSIPAHISTYLSDLPHRVRHFLAAPIPDHQVGQRRPASQGGTAPIVVHLGVRGRPPEHMFMSLGPWAELVHWCVGDATTGPPSLSSRLCTQCRRQ